MRKNNEKVFDMAREYLEEIYDAQNSLEASVDKLHFTIMKMKREKVRVCLDDSKVDSNLVTFDEMLSSNVESLYFYQRLFNITLENKELLPVNTLCSVIMKKIHYTKARVKKFAMLLEEIKYPDDIANEVKQVLLEIEDLVTNYSFSDVEWRAVDSKLDLLETIIMY